MENEKTISGGDYFRLLCLAALSLLLYAYLPDSYYIPFIRKAADPALFPDDLFVNSQSVYNSYYFVLLGRLSRHLELGVLLGTLHAVFVYAAALSVFALSMTLFNERKTAFLSVLLLLVPKCAVSLALAGINLGAPEPSEFAAPFLLLAIGLFLKRSYRTACLICGAMFYFQGMEALIVSLLFCSFFLARTRELPLPTVAVSALCLVLPVLPLAWKMLSAGFFGLSAPGDVARWLEVLRLRSWFHLFPFSWGLSDWFNYSGWFLWAFIVYRYGKPSPKQGTVLVFIKAIGLLCALSTVFTEFFPVPAVIKLVFWRSTIFFLFLLVVYISRYLIEFSERGAAAALLAVCSAVAVFLALYKLIVCFALLHLAFEARPSSTTRLLRAAGFAGLAAFVLGTVLPLDSGTPLLQKVFLFSDLGLKELSLFLLILSFSFPAFLLYGAGRSRAAWAALAFMAFSAVAVERLWAEKGAAAEQALNKDWVAAQLWTREHTAPDAVIITPASLDGFRTYSLRSVFLELKDGAACVYSPSFSSKWRQRLEDLGYRGGGEGGGLGAEMERIYGSLSENDVRELAGKYRASYFVAGAGSRYNLRELYRNGHFKIYSTEGGL